MELKLQRIHQDEKYTIGRLFVNGAFFCDTLEDRVRNLKTEKKVMHKTAIPAGRYKVIVNMSNRFKRILPLLLDVPQFQGIRIHRGNTAEDTSGCILVGINSRKGMVTNSAKKETELINLLSKESANYITIG